jgi:hypothetical protein
MMDEVTLSETTMTLVEDLLVRMGNDGDDVMMRRRILAVAGLHSNEAGGRRGCNLQRCQVPHHHHHHHHTADDVGAGGTDKDPFLAKVEDRLVLRRGCIHMDPLFEQNWMYQEAFQA